MEMTNNTVPLGEELLQTSEDIKRLGDLNTAFTNIITSGNTDLCDHQEALLKIADMLGDWAVVLGKRHDKYNKQLRAAAVKHEETEHDA